ncbi:MAG TPA: MogA/MoaB family molybdenum cofactor biosynthesis protein [Polyangiaceae bacterium]|nr:MogA/MoaB family molybdenum cofactor biosynthesis protein [Polyangiaceae bacterium]
MSRTSVRVSTITVSDTRTAETDESGRLLGELLTAAGCQLVSHSIVPDDRETLQALARELADREDVDALILCGGTGISARDSTIEAIEPLLDKRLDGFGEAFRRLSYDEIGARALLSRALAGTRAHTLLIALPGSTGAVRLAIPTLVAPLLEHAVALLHGHTRH